MLPATARLRRPDDFRATVSRGHRVSRGALVLHLLTRPADEVGSGSPALVGLVVSRTVGGAVVRNRVARRLRHVLRAHLASLPAGSRLVVRARPRAVGLASTELDRDLSSGLTRLLAAG